MAVRTRRADRLPPDERRAAIVAATLPLVLRHGIGVSTRQIAEAADVAEGTIFRVFPDKEALMRAVTARAFDPESTLRELAQVDREQPLRDRLLDGVRILQHRMTGVLGLIDALGLTHPPDDHHRRTINDAYRAAIVELVGSDRDRLRVVPVELAHVLRLLVISGSHPRICDGIPLTAEQIVALLLDGLLARPANNCASDTTEDRGC